MGVCVPKHIICETYIPDFIPGPTPCTLQTFNEIKSRLTIGGMFFRSIGVGAQQNDIQISCEWQYNNASVWTQTSDPYVVERVKLVVTNGIETETYYANQRGSLYIGVPPELDEFIWDQNAITGLSGLVAQITSSTLIVANITDIRQPWPSSPPPDPAIDHLDEFAATNMTGGTSGPTDASSLASIRTGPAMTMVLIADSERNTSNGSLITLNDLIYWNGLVWLTQDPTNPDCHDPANPPSCP